MAGIHFAVTADPNDALRGFQQVQRGIQNMSMAVENSGTGIDQLIAKLNQVGALIGVGFSVGQLSGFVDKVKETRSYFQDIESTMEVFLGSQEKAAAFTKKLQDYAYYNMFEFSDLAAASKQMIAYHTAADDVIPVLDKLSNIATGTKADLMDLVSMYNNAKSIGQLGAQQLEQWATRGVLVKETLQEMGETLKTNGKSTIVTFEQLEKVLDKVTGEGGLFHDLMANQMNNISAEAGQLEDNLDLMFNAIGEKYQDYITGFIKQQSAAVDWMTENYEQFLDPIANAVDFLKDNFVTDFVVEHLEGIAKVLTSLIAGWGAYRAALVLVNSAQKAITKFEYKGELAGIKLETEQLKKLIAVKNDVKNADLAEAVAKNKLTQEQADLIAKRREELELLRQETKGVGGVKGQELLGSTNEEIERLRELVKVQEEVKFKYDDIAQAVANKEITVEAGQEIERARQELEAVKAVIAAKQEEHINNVAEKDAAVTSAAERLKAAEKEVIQTRELVAQRKEYYDSIIKGSSELDTESFQIKEAIALEELRNAQDEEREAVTEQKSAAEQFLTAQTELNTAVEQANTFAQQTNTVATTVDTGATTANSVSTTANTAATTANTIGTRALTFAKGMLAAAINQVKVAYEGLKMAMMTNPLTAILTVATTAITVFTSLFAMFSEEEESVSQMTERFGQAASKTTAELIAMFNVLKVAFRGSSEYQEALAAINKITKEYGITLDAESDSIETMNDKVQTAIRLINEFAISKERANAIDSIAEDYSEGMDKIIEKLQEGVAEEERYAAAIIFRSVMTTEKLQEMAKAQQEYDKAFKENEDKKHLTKNDEGEFVYQYDDAALKKLQEAQQRLEGLRNGAVEMMKSIAENAGLSTDVFDKYGGSLQDATNQAVKLQKTTDEANKRVNEAADAAEKAAGATVNWSNQQERAQWMADRTKMSTDLLISSTDNLITKWAQQYDMKLSVDVEVPQWMQKMFARMTDDQLKAFINRRTMGGQIVSKGGVFDITNGKDVIREYKGQEGATTLAWEAWFGTRELEKRHNKNKSTTTSTPKKDKKTPKGHKSTWDAAEEHAKAAEEAAAYLQSMQEETEEMRAQTKEMRTQVDMEEGYAKTMQEIKEKRDKIQRDNAKAINEKTEEYEEYLQKQWSHKSEKNKGQKAWNEYKKKQGWTDEYFANLFSVDKDEKGNFKSEARQLDVEFKAFEKKLRDEFTATGKTIEDWAEHSKGIDLLELFVKDREEKWKTTNVALLQLVQWHSQLEYQTQAENDKLSKEEEEYYKDRLRSYGGYLEERREKLDKLYDDRGAIIAKMNRLAPGSEEWERYWKRYANALEGVNKQIREIDTDKLKGLLSLNRTNERSFLEQDYKEQRDDLTATLREAQEKRRGATREEAEEAQRNINNIIAAITELDKKHMQDLASFDAETMKSSDLWKSVFEDIGNATDESLSLMEKALVEFISQQKNLSPEKLKELRDALSQIQAQKFTNESNPFKKIAQSIDELAKKKKALDVVKDSLDYFYAYEQSMKGDKSIDKRYKAALASGDNEAIKAIQNEEVSIEVLDEKTGKVTETTMKYGEVLKLVARLTKDATDAEEKHTATLESAFEEIGKWNSRLKAAGQLFSDLGDAFGSNALQHIGEAIGMMTEVVDKAAEMGKMGAEIGGIWGAVAGASIGLFSSLSGAITKLLDARHERIIQRLARQIEDLDEKYQDLADAVSEAYSKEAAALIEEQNELLRQQYDLIEQQKAEEEAKKGTDKDKIREYEKQQRDIQKQIEDNEQAAIDAIFGEDVNSAISSFADAYASAWENGNSKAKTARDFVKRMIKSMVSELMKANISGGMEALRAKMLAYWEDNIITEAERASLNRDAEALGKQLDEQFSWANDLFRSVDEAGEGTAGGFATMSQDSADELNGRFSAIQVQGEVKINLLSQIVAQNVARAEAMANISTDTRIASDALVELKGLAKTRNAMIDNICSYVRPLQEQLERIASDIHVKL